MSITQFHNPNLLWLLLLLLPLIAWYAWRQGRQEPSIRISTLGGVADAPRTLRYRLRHLPFALRCAVITLTIIALARPQSSESGSDSSTEGIDIVLALDISSSMLARDFRPDRLTAELRTASRFIASRPDDRMGLVLFAGESFTQSPLTTDKRTLQTLLSQVRSGLLEDGTAIGNGLATAINRLKESRAVSKVVILLTDGVNNRGQIAPLTAAQIAATLGIRVYTIGVGTRGMAPYPAVDRFGRPAGFQNMLVEIDEQILTDIAAQTGGQYFRATDNDALERVYEQINTLEKSRIEITDYTRHDELFGRFLLWAIALLALEVIFRYLIIRRIP